MNDLKVVEICAGAGGQSLGLHKAGFQHELALELDESAAATLKHNLRRLHGSDPDVRVGDVADSALWTPEEYEGVDLLAGGVPCPPFSIAGKQLGSSDERDLFAWAVELAGRVKPRALLLENVRGLSTPRFSGYRQAVADRLGELGYWSEWRLIHASDFGVPQLRPRFILVAMSETDAQFFNWPEPNGSVVTVGAALRELMAEDGWKYADKWAAAANKIAPTVVGGSKKHGGADLGPTRAKRAWAELMVDGKGIANGPPTRHDPSFRTRLPRLTNQMVERLQGWGLPGYEWEFLGRKTSTYRQIGNAFPPPVAEGIGLSIVGALGRSAGVKRELEVQAHDELYRLLRNAASPMTETEIRAHLGPVIARDLAERIARLERDFDVQTVMVHGELSYVLGRFRAFQGQQDHLRHEHFNDRRRRSAIS